MFYDERINAEQGRAYRSAMIFALVILILYGALHGALLIANDDLNIAFMSVEIFCGIGGAILVAYGELRYGIRPADEMGDSEKRRYYSRAFFGFLYMFIFIYCCIRVPFSMALNANDIAPNHLIILLELSVWLLLLFLFKRNEVPINSSFLAVKRKDYWRRVLKNVGILGIATAFFSVTSAIITLALTENVAFFIGVLLVGLTTWISLASEYAIFSWAERSSDKAKEQGRISAATLVFAVSAVAVYLLYSGLSAYVIANSDAINSSAVVIRIQSINLFFGHIIFYFFGLFAVYLYSELKVLKSKGLGQAAILFFAAHLVSFCSSQILRVASSLVSGLIDSLGVSFLGTYSFMVEAADTLFLALNLIALTKFIQSLIELGFAGNAAYFFPAALAAIKATNLILSAQYRLSSLNAFIECIGTLAVYAAMLCCFFARRKKLEDLISEYMGDPR